jgi:hypothetical protein
MPCWPHKSQKSRFTSHHLAILAICTTTCLWSPYQPQALRALWITNTSNLTLDRGSFTIVEDGSFGGEGLLDPIHPGERRLLSYAADQAVRVTVDHRNYTHRVQHLSISKGVLKETTADIAEVEYLVHNAAPEPHMVIVEHPASPGWTIDSDPKPFESTNAVHRFRVATQAGETVRLHIGERHTLNEFFRLTDTTDGQLTLLLKNATPAQPSRSSLNPSSRPSARSSPWTSRSPPSKSPSDLPPEISTIWIWSSLVN